MKGVVLCHGRAHSPLPSVFLSMPVEWIYVDVNPNSHPDLVGDLWDPHIQQLLGPGTADIVIAKGCPVAYNMDLVTSLLQVAWKLLRVGRKFYMSNLIGSISFNSARQHRSQEIFKLQNEYTEGTLRARRVVNRYLTRLRNISGFRSYRVYLIREEGREGREEFDHPYVEFEK